MKLLNNHWVRYQISRLNPWKVIRKIKEVHRNLLLPLFSDPSDHTSKSDTMSMVDQTVSTHEVIAAGAVSSHVQNMSAYSRAWVANMFQEGLEFVTALFE